MPIRQDFLDWKRPALESAIQFLDHNYRRQQVWNLSQVIVVLPGGRAGRRLRELMVAQAEEQRWVFFPPEITTVGQLPELLYQRKRPFATPLVQKLAWAAALRSTPHDCLRQFLNDIPKEAADPRWFEIGSLLWNQHRELAGDVLDFADVAKAGPASGEAARWQALAQVQTSYLATLDRLDLWDRQTARRYAIQHNECQCDREIVLLATVDMNQTLRVMIDQVQDRVTALVHADPAIADHFDSHGCLLPDKWQDAIVPIRDEQILQVDAPADQGRAVVHFLSQLDGKYSANEITVGVPDETYVPLIQQQLQRAALDTRWGPGRSIEASRPVRLLRIVADYLQLQSYARLTELVRQPDVDVWLQQQPGISPTMLTALDQYQADHLPTVVNGDSKDPHRQSKQGNVKQIVDYVHQLLGDLINQQRRVTDWPTRILNFLHRVYRDVHLDPQQHQQRMILEGCQAVRDTLISFHQIPYSFLSQLSASEAILMAIDSIESKQIPATSETDAIELLGWLELPLDDAPGLVVTCLNEGTVPTSANSDLFLPNSLRTRLGLGDNARRYARDAYALTVLAYSRPDLCLVVGRRDWRGDPLSPSRLLFATDLDTIVKRAQRFFDESTDDSRLVEVDSGQIERQTHQFFVPAPGKVPLVTSLRVTDFRAYLACPYRFYLQRVLGLRSTADHAVELDGAMFGSLAHQVLDQFGSGPNRDSDDPDEIADGLQTSLREAVRERFGKEVRVAVQVQVARLEQRFREFAVQQAERRKNGWRIEHTEKDLKVNWGDGNTSVELRGRIDRIDKHEATDRWAILDYKTSDIVRRPRTNHLGSESTIASSGEDWQDLQLPLYRHLASSLGCEGDVELGYVLLPRDISKTGSYSANWSDEELKLADQAAIRVVQQIQAGRFWPPTEEPPLFSEDVAGICQDYVFDRRLETLGSGPASNTDSVVSL